MKSKADSIITAATTLFTLYGYNAPSIDKICEAAKVSKMTFYRHFNDKDQLIDEVLSKKRYQFIDAIKHISASSPTTRSKLLNIFNYYENWFKDEDFNGCLFSRALFETGYTNTKVQQINQTFRSEMLEQLCLILSDILKPEAAERISTMIMMLIDGAIIAQASNNSYTQEYPPAITAWQATKVLIYSEGGQLD